MALESAGCSDFLDEDGDGRDVLADDLLALGGRDGLLDRLLDELAGSLPLGWDGDAEERGQRVGKRESLVFKIDEELSDTRRRGQGRGREGLADDGGGLVDRLGVPGGREAALGRVEGREVGGRSKGDDGHTLGLEVFDRASDVKDALCARAHDRDGRPAELLRVRETGNQPLDCSGHGGGGRGCIAP